MSVSIWMLRAPAIIGASLHHPLIDTHPQCHTIAIHKLRRRFHSFKRCWMCPFEVNIIKGGTSSCGPILPIFELDSGLIKLLPYIKFEVNLLFSSRVIVRSIRCMYPFESEHYKGGFQKAWFDFTHIRTRFKFGKNITSHQVGSQSVVSIEIYRALHLLNVRIWKWKL